MGIITLWRQLQDGWKCEGLGRSCAQGHCMHVVCINMPCSFLMPFFMVVSWHVHGVFWSQGWCVVHFPQKTAVLQACLRLESKVFWGFLGPLYLFLPCFLLICYPYAIHMTWVSPSWGKGPFHCTGTPINLSLWWVKKLKKNWKEGRHLKRGQTRRSWQKSWELS